MPLVLFSSLIPPPPSSTLFPYTTLFRSVVTGPGAHLIFCAGTYGSSAGFLTDRKSTRLNSSHTVISYAVFCLKKKRAHRSQLGPGLVPRWRRQVHQPRVRRSGR